jgi:GNAT superfamily N-acetyltransferase
MSTEPIVRRDLWPGDLGAIIKLHGNLYSREYGLDSTFEGHVAASVSRAAIRGFPTERERIWLVEGVAGVQGSLALTDEGDGEGTVRWFVLDPSLRGRGLGRQLVAELMQAAYDIRYERLSLETFSELAVAARIYRSHGFELVWADPAPRWGREEITYQRYEVQLRPPPDAEGSGRDGGQQSEPFQRFAQLRSSRSAGSRA